MNAIESTITEIITQVNEFHDNYNSNEQAVRTQLIEPILNSLGWQTANPKFVQPNAPSDDGKIPDYTLLKDRKKILIVEAKNLSIDLQDKKIIDQLAQYCYNSGLNFGILTNGIKWLLFKTFETDPNDRIVWEVNLTEDKIDSVIKRLSSFAYSDIDTLDTLLKKSKLLDEVWTSVIKSTENIVEIIALQLQKIIKSKKLSYKINISDLKAFTKGKIEEIFELNEIEEELNVENISEDEETNFTAVEDSIFKRQKTKIREKISVTFPNNKIIKHKKVVNTFVETIKIIGVENILPLKIYQSGIPIISEVENDFYNQHKIGKYWIMVHTSTKSKVKILKEINKKLNLNLKIETFTV